MRTNAAASSKNSTRLQPLEPENSHTSASHAVLFYEHDSELLDTLAQSVSTAIMAGNSAIVIATRAHHNQLSALLKSRSVETYAAVLESRLFLLDAEETLARFMVDGQPDSARFAQALGPTIAQLVANARGESPSTFIFGETAPLLWEQGKYDAALRLEQLANELLASSSANILCAYPTRLFAGETHTSFAAEICGLHSCVIPSQDRSGPRSTENPSPTIPVNP
jgi:hypothetical protein